MAITWAIALLASLGLRLWGIQHPESFVIRPFLVFSLLFGPSVFLGIWLLYFGQRQAD